MKDPKIIYGDREFSFSNETLLSGRCVVENSLVGDELSVDALEVTVKSEDIRFFPLADRNNLALIDCDGNTICARPRLDDLTQFKYGAPVVFYHDGKLMGRFCLDSVTRAAIDQYKLYCVSSVGLLDDTNHYGGIYTGQTFASVAADIIGGVVDYTVSAALASVPLYGWLPIATRLDNLRQALLAVGGALKKTTAGTIEIVALSVDNPKPLNADRFFEGGDISYQTPTSGVEVTEHTYIAAPGNERITLFEGQIVANDLISPKGAKLSGALVTFDGPMHSLEITGGKMLESGVNYAVLGYSANCSLTGKDYTHTTRVTFAGQRSDDPDSIRQVTDATLVSVANGENIAKRMLAYYSAAKNIRADLVVGDERPGDPIQFTDMFEERTTGLLKSMDIEISGLLRASATVISGYTPTGTGNFYTCHAIITAAGAWTVPAGVTKIRVAVIGGGTGGGSGKRGGDGKQGGTNEKSWPDISGKSERLKVLSSGSPGPGGDGGKGGQGGKVYETTLDVTPGQKIACVIGRGGAGAAECSEADKQNVGSAGGATTFGAISSADGQFTTAGYINILTGEIYASPGGSGIKGGDGCGLAENGTQLGGSIAYNGKEYKPGESGKDSVIVRRYIGDGDSGAATGYAGFGGGAAAGANGAAGGNGSAAVSDLRVAGWGGLGGKGATPIAPGVQTVYGGGGHGGHGGGGGGAHGGAEADYARSKSSTASQPEFTVSGKLGEGGNGGAGGKAADGCIIVYY